MHRRHPRYYAHLVMVGLIVATTAVTPPRVIPVAHASTPTPTPVAERLLPEATGTPSLAPRATTSERAATPSPLPTPVAVVGTPLPTPVVATPTPVPTPVPAAPAPPATAGWPVAGGTVSQYFSAAHPAVDISAPCGTPVLAVWSGTVQYAGWKDNGGGYVVDILFDNGLLGSYNHLSTVSALPGVWVPAGAVLGAVGMTGIATGCHLHWAILVDGAYQNPLAFL